MSVSYPLPETKFFEKVKLQLKEKQNWTDSNDLAMMYQATYSTDFYRQLHRYIHKIFRLKQGWLNFKKMLSNPSWINLKHLRSALATIYYLPASLLDYWRLRRLEQSSTSNS